MLRTTIRNAVMTTAALGALGLGGAALASAADTSSTQTSPTASAPSRPLPPERQPLSADVAAKVKAAALDEVPGATVLRTEAGGPYGTQYHAHIRTADGTRKVVLVDGSFAATAVRADKGRRGQPGPARPGHHCGRGETASTGDAKDSAAGGRRT